MHELRLHTARDVLVEQLDDVIGKLKKDGRSDATVHDVRQELRRARAALRLLRKSIGADAYRRDNRALRDVARLLTPLRDARVLVRTLDRLRRVDDDHDLKAAASLLRRQFQEERHVLSRQLLRRHLVAAADTVQSVKERMLEIPRARLDEVAIGWGIGRAYEAGRKTFGRVKDRPTDARLHEWRKQVKYHLYQIDVARQLGAAKFERRRKHLHRLSDVLGDDHDLAVLNARITASAARAASRRIALRIEKRRTALQREAHRLGNLLYDGTAKRPRSLRGAI